MRRILAKTWKWFLVGLLLVWGIAACNWFSPQSKQLPQVAPLSVPQTPDWIEQISPVEAADPLAQIRIRFKEPLIPLESLESSDRKDKLAKFEITPQLPGRFRFLTPRMVGFQADKAIPEATRVQVTIKAGLTDTNDRTLERDIAWTFHTPTIQLSNLPQYRTSEDAPPNPIELEPTLQFISNVELDLKSVNQHAALIAENDDKRIPVNVELDEKQPERDDPRAQFDPSARQWHYVLTPKRKLEKDTNYRLEFEPGLEPANGNIPSETQFVSNLKTYAPLALNQIESFGKPDAGGTFGRFENGSPRLEFNNGLVEESAIEHISISPPPKEFPSLIRADDDEPFVNLNPWALEPNTNYTITIESGLEDKFGQTLDETIAREYKTGNLAPDIWAPTGTNIFPASQDLALNISAVNLPESQYRAAYKAIEPTELVFAESPYPSDRGYNLLPQPSQWQTFPISTNPNETTTVEIPLRDRLGQSTGMLAYGVRARTNRYEQDGRQEWREPDFYGMVQLTDLGVFAQWFPDTGLVKVNHLSDGSPAANATVNIYQSRSEARTYTEPSPCATGNTDESGMFLIDNTAMRQCAPDAESAPELVVIARENQDWSFARTSRYSGAYGYGIDAGWSGSKPVSRGTIFSDRQLYQPGETAEFTAVAYYLQNGELVQDSNDNYAVTLVDPDDNKTSLGNYSTNEFGTFSLELPLEDNQSLGNYSLRAKADNGVEISGEFRVAEFNPPNFKVNLDLNREFAFANDELDAKVDSDYLFGAPVSTGRVTYYVTRRYTRFTPEGWDEFNFGRQWFWPEERPSVSSNVLEESETLDDTGTASLSFSLDKDLPDAMNYRVDAEVTDVSNLSVADSRSFTALPNHKLIGLKTDFVADAGEEFEVEVIATNPQGEAISGESIRLELQKMDYSSVTRVVEGSAQPNDQVQYETVDEVEVRSRDGAQTVSLTPTDSGSYRIRANFANAKDETSATDTRIWVSGADAVGWRTRGNRDNYLEVTLDKDTYQPGDTATALVQSPYEDAELYFAVVRDRVLYRTSTRVTGGAPQVQFTVTPQMLPNAAVEAVLVRRGDPLERTEPGRVDDLVKIGFAPFETGLQQKYLDVAVNPAQPEVQPGAEETVRLQVRDENGNPVQAQLTVMAVNEAVLQLTGYRPPDLVETVYAEQPIATRFSDNRFDVVLSPLSSPLEKGWGYGGGFSAGAASTQLRAEFEPLAYYNGAVVTDRNGEATVSFTLPDNLTEWRVMAVAATEDVRFGNGEATFKTTKPLMANPILPQFARKGDRFLAGLSLTNTTDTDGRVDINGESDNLVQFADGGTVSQQDRIESGTQAYRFEMQAADTGEATVRFAAQLQNQFADAFEISFPVKQLRASESVVESGTTDDRVAIPVNLAEDVVPDVGGLTLDLASTLIPEITAPARKTFDGETLPFLEPTASQLQIAANLQRLGQQYGQSFAQFNPMQQGTAAISRLRRLQQPDGGFSSYPGSDRSDPFVTSYAAESLASASDAGIPVETEMVSQTRAYLKTILADPGKYDFCKSQSCKNRVRLGALIALDALGEQRNDFLAQIYSQRSELDLVAQIQLARYLFKFPNFQQQARSLLAQLQETVYETGRSATVNLPQRWGWLSSATTAQAEMLKLAVAQGNNPQWRDRLLRSLLDLRRDGTWQNTYANARALSALVAYSQQQPEPPNFTATATLAGNVLDTMQFRGYQNPSRSISVGMPQLPKGEADLVLEKSGRGTLHYLVEYAYRLSGNQPGRFNGLRVTRHVRPAGEEEILQSVGLSKPDKPLSVQPGQVFDIGLEIICDRPVNHVVIVDPLPAGFEAVDTSFQTATSAVQAQVESWEIGYQTIHRDRVTAYGDRLEPGVYQLHYLARSVTPGTFEWPGAEVHLQYAPEEFGRSASVTLEVEE